MSHPSNNRVVQQLQLLLGGYGFNFYSNVNLARADDLLVRQAASGHLTSAVLKLAQLEMAFRNQFVPPSTREQPYPPASVMQSLREITALKQKVSDLETSLRGMPVPTQDKIWWRFRDEQLTLISLLECDRQMIEQAISIEQAASQLTASAWGDSASGAHSALNAPIAQLENAMQNRMRMLQLG